MAIRLIAFFEGAVSYRDIKTMPLSELLRLQDISIEISKEREAEINKRLNHGKHR